MFSWLVYMPPDQADCAQALARDIVCCSWERHFTLTVPLSTQMYEWAPVNLMVTGRCDGPESHSGNQKGKSIPQNRFNCFMLDRCKLFTKDMASAPHGQAFLRGAGRGWRGGVVC